MQLVLLEHVTNCGPAYQEAEQGCLQSRNEPDRAGLVLAVFCHNIFVKPVSKLRLIINDESLNHND